MTSSRQSRVRIALPTCARRCESCAGRSTRQTPRSEGVPFSAAVRIDPHGPSSCLIRASSDEELRAMAPPGARSTRRQEVSCERSSHPPGPCRTAWRDPARPGASVIVAACAALDPPDRNSRPAARRGRPATRLGRRALVEPYEGESAEESGCRHDEKGSRPQKAGERDDDTVGGDQEPAECGQRRAPCIELMAQVRVATSPASWIG